MNLGVMFKANIVSRCYYCIFVPDIFFLNVAKYQVKFIMVQYISKIPAIMGNLKELKVQKNVEIYFFLSLKLCQKSKKLINGCGWGRGVFEDS